MGVCENLAAIRQKIRESAIRSNRNPDSITLIAVTKYVDTDLINEAIDCGIKHVAENRVQEGVKKFPLLNGQVVKHLIGTLQTNKIKPALQYFDIIHSVDRPSLIEELAKQTQKMDKRIEFLIQLNISGESTKHGLTVSDLPGILELLNQYPSLIPSGLMTMAPFVDDPEKVRPVFRQLRELFDQVALDPRYRENWRYLSMGMSQDFQVAVEEGANLLRIGTAIFK